MVFSRLCALSGVLSVVCLGGVLSAVRSRWCAHCGALSVVCSRWRAVGCVPLAVCCRWCALSGVFLVVCSRWCALDDVLSVCTQLYTPHMDFQVLRYFDVSALGGLPLVVCFHWCAPSGVLLAVWSQGRALSVALSALCSR